MKKIILCIGIILGLFLAFNLNVNAVETSSTAIKEYKSYKPDFSVEEDTCAGILGDPEDNVGKPPAYYLQFVFNLIKYIAIIILLVLTVIDFLKAITSSKDDGIKKAGQQAIKRLIICTIIFFLPILIKFVLELLGIYGGTCSVK